MSESPLNQADADRVLVLSDGLTLGWFEGLVFLDFGPYTSEPDGVDDFRRSGCYFAGLSATWEVVPYAESTG
jgi:hypothetical protein